VPIAATSDLVAGDIVMINHTMIDQKIGTVRFRALHREVGSPNVRYITQAVTAFLKTPAIITQIDVLIKTYIGIVPCPDLCLITFVVDGHEWYVPRQGLVRVRDWCNSMLSGV
jgi:hypothetical protein